MNKFHPYTTSIAVLFVAASLHFSGLGRALAEDKMLYKMTTEDFCEQILGDLRGYEKETVFLGRGIASPSRQNASTAPKTSKESPGLNVILLFDVSRSVVNKSAQSGTPMSEIKKEAVKLIDSLPPSTHFNVVQFTRNYLPFKQSLVPANADNRKDFQNWVRNKWNDTGTLSSETEGATKNPAGILGVLEFSKKMKPDVVYLISDGSFEQGKSAEANNVEWRDVSKALASISGNGKKIPVNFIAFAPKPSDAKEMKKIAGNSGGRFREMAKKS